jgi:hypothetical protein
MSSHFVLQVSQTYADPQTSADSTGATVPSAPSSSTLAPTPKAMHLAVAQVAQTSCAIGKRHIVIAGRPLPKQSLDKSPVPITSNSIERMRAHRKQLSAETGQLERRVRRVSSASSKLAAPASASDSGSDITNPRAVSRPSSKSESSATLPGVRREVIPLPSFVEGNFGSKRAPPTAWTQKMDELVEEKIAESKSRTPTLTPENLSHLNKTHRKVNDGFEILPAGALAKPAPLKEFGLWPEHSIKFMPDNETRPMRKLQKRNRSHSGSRSQRSSSDGGLSDKEN